jgi:small subunit ribosomal protein S8
MDTIGNVLTKIRNAQMARHESVEVPYSNLTWSLVNILQKEGFIKEVEKKGRKENRLIEINLKYNAEEPAIQSLNRISKPSKRIYAKYAEIYPRKGRVAILSTPKGLLTDREARKNKIGGEVICEIE